MDHPGLWTIGMEYNAVGGFELVQERDEFRRTDIEDASELFV
jgi:hypothetical protein